MSERENLGAGVYAALSGLVFLIALVGAFMLPPTWVSAKWLGIPVLVAFFIGIPILLNFAHRSRIRDAVGTLGGTVVRIKKLPFWRQPVSPRWSFFLGVRFAVQYIDLTGVTHEAQCNSGFFQGVVWLDDAVINVLE